MKRVGSACLAVAFVLLPLQAAQQSDSPVDDTVRLSLAECVKMSLSNNLNIKKSVLNTESSRLGMVASYLNLLPSVNASASGGTFWGRSIDPTSNAFITRRNQSVGIRSSSSILIFNGLRNLNSIRKSRTDLAVSQETLEVQRNATILAAVNLYLNVLLSKELLVNANYQLQSTEEQIRRTQKMVEAGSSAPVDLLNMRSQAASNQVQVVQRQNTLNLSLLNLKQALFIPYEQQLDIKDDSLAAVVKTMEQELNVSVETIYKEALGTRPEIKQADLRVRSSDLQLKISRAGLMPTLGLNGGLGTNYSSAADRPRAILGENVTREVEIGFLKGDPSQRVVRNFTSREVVGVDESFGLGEQLRENLNQSLGLSLSVPVFQRWNNRIGVQQAKISRNRARIEAQEARNTLRTNIEQAYNEARAAAQLYQAAEYKVEATEEAFRLIEKQYTLGTASYTDYVVQSNSLFQARSELLQSKYTFAFRKKILDFYRGTLTY